VDTAEITRRLTRRFGAGVEDWCAGVPALASQTAERWSLVLGDPFPGGAGSVALRCTRSDGSPAVLKLSPDLPVVSEQVAMLTAFGASDPCFDAVDYLLDGAGLDGVDARCAALAEASGLDGGRLFAWCRAVAPIVAIIYLGRPGREHAIPELLTLAQ
jgi:hypothetical protein